MKTIQRYLSFSNLLPTFIYISFLCIYVLGYDYKRKQQGFRKGTEALPCKALEKGQPCKGFFPWLCPRNQRLWLF